MVESLNIDFVDQQTAPPPAQPDGLQIDFADQPEGKQIASGVIEAAQAGYESSALGLMQRGKLPDVQLDPTDSDWYERLAAGAAQMVSETPFGVVGAFGGAAAGGSAGTAVAPGPGTLVGGLLGGGFGAFALPAAIRESYMQAYSKGEITSTADFLGRASVVLGQTVKEGTVGLLTAGTGKLAQVGAKTAGLGAKATGASVLAAQGSTLAVAPALLEGRLPEPQEIMDAAIMLVGFRAATVGAAKLANIYAKTGKTPLEVMADAKSDPTIVEDLAKPAPINVFHGTKANVEIEQLAKTEDIGPHFTTSRSTAELFANKGGTPGKVLEGEAQFGKSIELPDLNIWFPTEIAKAVDGVKGIKEGDYNQTPFESRVWQVMEKASKDYLDSQPESYQRLRNKLSGLTPEETALKDQTRDKANQKATDEGYALIRSELKAEGFDSIKYKNMNEGEPVDTYIALEPGKVRSKPATAELPRAYQSLAREEMLNNVLGAYRDPKGTGTYDPALLSEVVANPFGRITPTKKPNHINYRYVDGPEDVKAVQARIAEVFSQQIEAQRGTESWAKTQEGAAEILRNRRPEELVGRDLNQLAAESMAQQAMAQAAASDLAQVASEIRAAGELGVTPEMAARQAQAIETLAMLHAIDQGNGAAIARALNARKAAQNVNALGKEASELLTKYRDDPQKLAQMVGELGDVTQLSTFAVKASKASVWEKVIEAWKSGLVSGLVTQVANIMGNTTFMATRPLVDAVAVAVGRVRGGPEAMAAAEPLARVLGNIQGTIDGSKAAFAVLRTGDGLSGKVEYRYKAIEGKAGEIIRTPFRVLSAADAFFRVTNERGEAYALATRQAAQEGYNPATREFRERVSDIAANPTDKMAEQIEAAGLRFTFNSPLGEKGRAVQQTIKKLHLEWAIPFVQTPINVAKEMLRLTPAAPIIKEWRDAISKGGPEANKAIAEIAIGTAVGTTVFSMALSGNISGQGDADPRKRAAQLAGGWQPYSLKVGDTWYSYQRLQPVGTLIGMAADAAAAWENMGEEERDKVPKILSTAFANAITNQTFLQGVTNIVNAMSDPDRYGSRLVQNMTASLVPGIIGQTADMLDPYRREVYSVLDAVQYRIPGARENLQPKRDPFGEPIPAKDRLAGISPITVSTESTDKVRTEVARLGVGVSKAPDNIELPAGRDPKLGKIELTPEQRDIFAEKSGKVAYEGIQLMVNSPWWDTMPDMAQRIAIEKVFEQSRKVGKAFAVPPEQIMQKALQISTELEKRLQTKTLPQ